MNINRNITLSHRVAAAVFVLLTVHLLRLLNAASCQSSKAVTAWVKRAALLSPVTAKITA